MRVPFNCSGCPYRQPGAKLDRHERLATQIIVRQPEYGANDRFTLVSGIYDPVLSAP
jgi:hypothetical protein